MGAAVTTGPVAQEERKRGHTAHGEIWHDRVSDEQLPEPPALKLLTPQNDAATCAPVDDTHEAVRSCVATPHEGQHDHSERLHAYVTHGERLQDSVAVTQPAPQLEAATTAPLEDMHCWTCVRVAVPQLGQADHWATAQEYVTHGERAHWRVWVWHPKHRDMSAAALPVALEDTHDADAVSVATPQLGHPLHWLIWHA